MITTYTAAFSPTMRWPCPLLWVGASSVALAVGGLSPVGPSRLGPSSARRSVSGQAFSLMLARPSVGLRRFLFGKAASVSARFPAWPSGVSAAWGGWFGRRGGGVRGFIGLWAWVRV